MNGTEQIDSDLARDYNVLLAQLEGLTHEDSLLQVPFRGNCLNWVLGHILTYRATMLEIVGLEPFEGAESYERYRDNCVSLLIKLEIRLLSDPFDLAVNQKAMFDVVRLLVQGCLPFLIHVSPVIRMNTMEEGFIG